MKSRKIHIVVNPAAGSGKAKRVADELLQNIRSLTDSVVSISYTGKKDDAVFITREAIVNGTDVIIAVGGDGTVNEVVNGFFVDDSPINKLCELGIINCGTGGGYAGTLKLPSSLEQQIGQILQPGFINLDLGSVKCHDSSGKIISRLFVNECQTGIGSKVASIAGKNYKLLGGALAFGLVATVQAMKIKPLSLNLKYDDEEDQDFDLIGLVIGNGIECAGGMKLTPDAKLDDGLFDVLSMHDMSMLQRLLNLSKVYSGSHVRSHYFSVKRCRKIIVRSEQMNTVEADGELLGFTPMEINILPNAIRVKAGNNAAG